MTGTTLYTVTGQVHDRALSEGAGEIQPTDSQAIALVIQNLEQILKVAANIGNLPDLSGSVTAAQNAADQAQAALAVVQQLQALLSDLETAAENARDAARDWASKLLARLTALPRLRP
jgi:broad specificity polyphosphatase/5'/3'-nucleotidase SurE